MRYRTEGSRARAGRARLSLPGARYVRVGGKGALVALPFVITIG